MKAFTLEADLTLTTSGFSEDLAKVQGTLNSDKSLAGFTAWGTTIGNLASKAFSKAFSAGVQFAKDVINKTMDFEATMSAVESVSQASASDMERLTAKARELGGSTIYTAEEVGQAMFYMGQAGWSTQQILAGIGGVMDLAAASGDDLSRVSDIVTDSIYNFGLTADDTRHYVDVLAQTARNSNTNISMVGEAFKYVSPVAKALGYSIDDVSLALGLAANNGIKASQAGTSLRTILNNLINPGDEAGIAMAKWGISIDDNTGKIKSFSTVIEDFRKAAAKAGYDPETGRTVNEIAAAEERYATAVEEATAAKEAGKLTDKQYEQSLENAMKEYEDYTHFNKAFLQDISEIAGLRGLSTLLAIMNANQEDYGRVVEQIKGSEGAAAEMAETQRDNLKGDITLFNSAVDDLQLSLGDTITEPARGLVQKATAAVTSLNTALTAGKGKLNTDQMERIMDKYEAWNKTSNLQFITKSNKAAELYRTIANELEAAGASEEEVANFVNQMQETGNAGQLLELIQTLQGAQSEVSALNDEAGTLKSTLDGVAGDYNVDFYINTHGSIPNIGAGSDKTGGGGAGGLRGAKMATHEKGGWDIPYDNYVASLHRGEMILTKTQAREYRNGNRGDGASAAEIGAAMSRAMRNVGFYFNDREVARTFGNSTTGRVNRNIVQANRRHHAGYGG